MKWIKNNKRGASLIGWTEGIMLSFLFVSLLGMVVTQFNGMYMGDNQLGFGNQTASTFNGFSGLEETSAKNIKESEQTQTDEGFTLKKGWTIGRGMFSTLGDFFAGGFITQICGYLQIDEDVGIFITLLYQISLVIIIVGMVFRMVRV